MKKLFLIWGIVLLPLVASADAVEINGIYYNLDNSLKTAEVTNGFNEYSGDIVIPETVKYNGVNYNVNSIGKNAFNHYGVNSYMSSIAIPKTIVEIGERAFYACNDLKVYISDIAAWCKIKFYDSNCFERHRLFLNGDEIKDLVIPEGLTSIGDHSFADCILYNVTIPNSVTSIGDGAFSCSYLSSIIIPSSVKTIGEYAFYRCNLTKIEIPEGVEYIGSNAFNENKYLNTVIIPKSVTNIGGHAFKDCHNLSSVYITDLAAWCQIEFGDVEGNPLYYGHHIYLNDEEIHDLIIPEGLNSIGNYAFIGCSGIYTIAIPQSVESIGADVFMGTGWYDNHANGMLYIGKFAYKYKGEMPENTQIDIKENTIGIAGAAFNGCQNLVNVAIPNSVKSIGDAAFRRCSSLITLRIPDNITIISNSVFEECSKLNEITIPDNAISIGDNAFYGCYDLVSLKIGLKIRTIGNEAFAYCQKLTSVNIPNNVLDIGDNAFYQCINLSNLIIGNNVNSIGVCAFFGCKALSNVEIPNSVTTIGDGAFSECFALTTINIGENVKNIGDYTFYQCSNLEKIVIPSNVISIGNGTFSHCSGLSSIVLGKSVESLGEEIFNYCNKLRSVYCYMPFIPSTVYDTFNNFEASEATLYVNKEQIEQYSSTLPWDSFGEITNLPCITYMINDEVYKVEFVTVYDTIIPLEDPIKVGHTFSGWSDIPEKMPEHDITITGYFTKNKYILTYILDGEEYKSYEIEYDSKITPEPAPTKEGYTFSGWSWIPSKMPADNVTVTGSFIPNNYKLTYIVDGEVYMSSEVAYDSPITPEAEPNKEGYTFSGWSYIPSKMPAEDVTVTGSFTINKYTLTYMIDDEVYKEEEYDYNATIVPEQQPEGDYISFEWVGLPETMPAYDVTVNASYETGIQVVIMPQSVFRIYNLNGLKVNRLQKGINIIQMSDGSMKKVMKK